MSTSTNTGSSPGTPSPGADVVSRSATTETVLVRPSEPAFADRMREIQLIFIDDPRKAALAADRLVEDLVRALSKDLAKRRAELDQLMAQDSEDAPATEQLRISVRRCRELVGTLASARRQAGL